MRSYLHLGASLYVPATRGDLPGIGNGQKYPHLRSVIFCTEDAIGPRDVPAALSHIESALLRFDSCPMLRFVRARNPAVLRSLLQMNGVERLAGFVLPKVTSQNLDEYMLCFRPGDPFHVMVTLETADVFDPLAMVALRDRLLKYRGRILTLRVGGNDLLQVLNMRRPRGRTIYSTPVGALISQLAMVFRPHGFNLTGPVFDYLDRGDVLARETRQDLAHGLFGKSAIHPEQVPIIEEQYRVEQTDLESAERILDNEAPPVFRLHDAMCEPATHRAWAEVICQRAQIYGVRKRRQRKPPRSARHAKR